ncbi:MAG TPA: amidohydrolase, partial [Vicinamibacteria bacterium]|nr:amidohydrolase [Vicinamibacteria bacterium]
MKETHVQKPRFPVVDVHTHFTFARGGRQGAASEDAVAFNATAKDALAVMDRKGVRAVVNLTGGFGQGLEEALAALDRAHPGRFYTCTEPMWGAFPDARFPQRQADAIEKAAQAGAKGLKVLKTLGLYLREKGREGPLVKVDD